MTPIGSGIDIVEIQRIRDICKKHGDHFINKLLHPNEIEELKDKTDQAAFVAKRFAVKEATVKALGVGIGSEIGFKDIYVQHDGLGKPLLKFTASCQEKFDLNNKHALLTIADEKSYAVAHVLLFIK